MSVKVLYKITEEYLDSAVRIWHKGVVLGDTRGTTLWVAGPRRELLALPADEIGSALSREARIGLHALMALGVKARYIGRVDETFAQVGADTTASRSRYELERIIDIDPTIHTAIAVESLELATMTNLLKIAHLEIGAEGEPTWIKTTHPDPGDMTVDDIRSCGAMINDPSHSDREARLLTFADLDELMRDLHWVLVAPELRTREPR